MRGSVIIVLMCFCTSTLDAQLIDCSDPSTQESLYSPAQQLNYDQRMTALILTNRAISDRPISRKSYAAQLVYNVFRRPSNRINIGMNIAQRTIGSAELGMMRYGLLISDDQRVGERSVLTVGISAFNYAYTIDRDKLTWSDQYTDQGLDPSILTMDAVNITSQQQLDFAIGIGFRHFLRERTMVNKNDQYYSINASVDGLMESQQGIYIMDNARGRTFQLSGSASIRIAEGIYLSPMIRGFTNNLNTSVLLGTYAELQSKSGSRQRTMDTPEQKVSLGIFLDTRKRIISSVTYSRGAVSFGIDLAAGLYGVLEDDRMPSSTGVRVGVNSFRSK